MSQILYEQYKDALRRGHIAALRGRLDLAVAAYEVAAAIAPDRALPHASLGAVLARLGRIDAAEAAYAAALQRAPGDETALRGRAEMRAEHGNRLDSARDFEILAEELERGGRTVDACDAARRALELAESRTRRRTVERLAALLREQDADPAAAEALRLAMQLLEPVRVETRQAAADTDEIGPAAVADDAEALLIAAEPAAEDHHLDAVATLLQAEAQLDANDLGGARTTLLALASHQRAMGRLDAALDACFVLMAIDPNDTELQLEVTANQLARGWSSLASEKVRLLTRLAELDEDEAAAGAVAIFVIQHGLGGPDGGSIATRKGPGGPA